MILFIYLFLFIFIILKFFWEVWIFLISFFYFTFVYLFGLSELFDFLVLHLLMKAMQYCEFLHFSSANFSWKLEDTCKEPWSWGKLQTQPTAS